MTARGIVDRVFLVISLTGLVLGTSWLPYRFPPSHLIAGVSYEVGFNNGVAYLWFLLFLPVPVWAALRVWGRGNLPSLTRPFGATLQQFADRFLAAALVAHTLLFGAIYFYKGRFVFAEALYFQTLLYRMTGGEVPYVDFSFYYGPSMLYPAAWLTPIVGLDAAYGVWFVATYLAGLVVLYALLRALLPLTAARAWFVLLAVGFLTPWTGLNVTFLRFLLPSVVFFAVAALLTAGGRLRFLATAGLLAFALLYSFEVAALAVASCVILTALAVAKQPLPLALDGPQMPVGGLTSFARGLGILGVAGSFSVLAFFVIDPSGRALRLYPEIALSYSAGAHNVPIYPNLPFLALVVLTVIAASGTIGLLIGAEGGGSRLLLGAYLVIALLTQRGIFGVAEPTHFAFFGLPILLVCLFLTTQGSRWRSMRPWLAVAVVAGFVFPLQYYHVTQLRPFFARPASWSAGGPEAGAPRGQRVEMALMDAVRSARVDRPWVMYDLDYYSLPVYRRFHLRYPTYYTMLINARTLEGVDRAIRETRATRALVLIGRDNLVPGPGPSSAPGVPWLLDSLSGAHTAGSQLTELLTRNKARLSGPYREFLQAEYEPVWERDGLVVLAPKADRFAGSAR